MKPTQRYLNIGTGVLLTTGLILLSLAIPAPAETPGPVPFKSAPSLTLAGGSDLTIYVKQTGGGYSPLTFGISTPFPLLSTPQSVARIVSGGYTLDTPIAPAGVGPASQMPAVADFLGDRSPGAAFLQFRNPNVLKLVLRTTAFGAKTATDLAIGPGVQGAISGDFNRDGKLDIAAVYSGNQTTTNGGIAILMNNGSGTFAAPVIYPAGKLPLSIAAFDLNKDGILDLAAVDGSQVGLVYVLLGQAGGTFTAAGSYAVGATPQSVTIADFDRDTNPDLAVAALDGTVTILRGNGTGGSFQALAPLQSPLALGYIAAGDLNRDGKLDLALAGFNSATVTIALGNGDGTFSLNGIYVTSDHPDSLIITDFDNDGNLDVLNGSGDQRGFAPSATSNNLDILLGNGDGTLKAVAVTNFGKAGATVVSGDFNGDGKLDVVTNDLNASKLFLLNGLGNGKFAAAIAIDTTAGTPANSGRGPQDAAVGDFNGDGRPDLAVVEGSSGTIGIYLNSGSGFQSPVHFFTNGNAAGDSPIKIVAADFSGDGRLDLAVVHGPYPSSGVKVPNLSVFIGGANGSFAYQQTYITGLYPTGLAAADVNGDGKADLIVADQGNQFITPPIQGGLMVLLSTGAGFGAAQKFGGGEHPLSITTGDLNGDGSLDLIAGNVDNSFGFKVATVLGNGNGTFQAAKVIASDFGPGEVVVRDFNGDKKADVIVAHCCGDTKLGFYTGNGDGTLLNETLFNGIGSPIDAVAGDFNNDGLVDLAAVSQGQGNLALLLNTGEHGAYGVNAASFATDLVIAPDSIATVFGDHLAAGSTLSNATVVITDSAGRSQTCKLFNVFPGQINFLVPADVELGLGTLKVTSSDGVISTGSVTIAAVAPGIFASGSLANGIVVRYDSSGKQLGFDYTLELNAHGLLVPKSVSMGNPGDSIFLLLYGTGIRGATLSQVTMQAGTTKFSVQYAGAQGEFAGEDQINIPLPASLRGAGTITITTTVAGKAANAVTLVIQ